MKPEVANDLQIENVVLRAPELIASDQTWRTSITDVQLTGRGSLKCNVQRPDSGSSTGGYLMLYKDEISVSGTPVIRQFYSGKGDFSAEIGSDEVDFTKHNYVLCYAPHYSDNIRMVVTSVQIMFGRPFNLKLSACAGISQETNSVTSYYTYDSNPLGFGYYNAWILVREGGVMGEGAQVGISSLDRFGPAEGVCVTSIAVPLQRGKTNNVTTNLYSTVRPVAGYTFTVPR